jgi:hypothetical protein
MPLSVTGNTFTEVCNRYGSNPGNSGQHVRGMEYAHQLYTHNPLMPNGSGAKADHRREVRYAIGAQLVKKMMINEYGEVAKKVFDTVKARVNETTGRNIEREITRGDVNLLQQELRKVPQPRKLEELNKKHTAEVIKDDLTANWTSAAKQQFHPVQWLGGAEVVGPQRSMDGVKEGYYRVRWHGDPEVDGLRANLYGFKDGSEDAEVAGPRPLFEVREEYFPVQCPGNGADAAEVGLRHIIYLDHVRQGSMQFDDEKGTLTLRRDGLSTENNEERNMEALAGFIGRHFGVEPGQPAFQNIANNILSYLPRGKSLGEAVAAAQEVAGDAARADRIACLRTFTLSVTKDGNVGVEGDIKVAYTNVDGDPLRPAAYSKYRFVREEAFEISGEHLTVDPTAFDAEANLVSVGRSDIAGWARAGEGAVRG